MSVIKSIINQATTLSGEYWERLKGRVNSVTPEAKQQEATRQLKQAIKDNDKSEMLRSIRSGADLDQVDNNWLNDELSTNGPNYIIEIKDGWNSYVDMKQQIKYFNAIENHDISEFMSVDSSNKYINEVDPRPKRELNSAIEVAIAFAEFHKRNDIVENMIDQGVKLEPYVIRSGLEERMHDPLGVAIDVGNVEAIDAILATSKKALTKDHLLMAEKQANEISDASTAKRVQIYFSVRDEYRNQIRISKDKSEVLSNAIERMDKQDVRYILENYPQAAKPKHFSLIESMEAHASATNEVKNELNDIHEILANAELKQAVLDKDMEKADAMLHLGADPDSMNMGILTDAAMQSGNLSDQERYYDSFIAYLQHKDKHSLELKLNKAIKEVNLKDIEASISAGAKYTPAALRAVKSISDPIKRKEVVDKLDSSLKFQSEVEKTPMLRAVKESAYELGDDVFMKTYREDRRELEYNVLSYQALNANDTRRVVENNLEYLNDKVSPEYKMAVVNKMPKEALQGIKEHTPRLTDYELLHAQNMYKSQLMKLEQAGKPKQEIQAFVNEASSVVAEVRVRSTTQLLRDLEEQTAETRGLIIDQRMEEAYLAGRQPELKQLSAAAEKLGPNTARAIKYDNERDNLPKARLECQEIIKQELPEVEIKTIKEKKQSSSLNI